MTTYRLEGINPEPWTVGTASVGRAKGKMFARIAKDAGLTAYQNAVKEELVALYPNIEIIPKPTPVALEFFLWRQIVSYEKNGRTYKRKRADATNLQKALEDALQGILFENDSQVVSIFTVLTQSEDVEPSITIRCRAAAK